jgi:PAS domain S-box-containing protein
MPSLRLPDLAALLEAVPLGAYVFRLENPSHEESLRIVFANRESKNALGIEPASVIGTLIGDRFPNALGESGIARAYRDAIVEQASHDLGVISYGDEGLAEQRFAVSIHPLDEETAVLLFDNLSASTGRTSELAAIVDNAEDAILSKNLDGTILTWNPAAERMYGYSAPDAVGKPISMLLPPDRTDEVENILRRLVAGEHIEHFETRRKRKDDTVIDVSLTVSPIEDRQGRIVGAATIARDIGEKKARDERMRHLAAIVAASEDAIFSRTHEAVVSWNLGAEQLFGYSATEMIGTAVDMLHAELGFNPHGEHRGAVEALTRGERSKPFETRLRRKDGSEVDVSVASSAIVNSTGDVIGVASVIRDMSEQRRLETQLRQSQKLDAIGSLAGGVAHDFNNVLTIVRSTSQLLLNELNDESSRERIKLIDSAAEHAAALTGQLLAFSRQQVLQPEATDLNAVVEATLVLVEPIIGAQIEIVRELGLHLAKIHVDRTQLQQVILNLSINARDAMPDGGTLRIRTSNVVLDEGYASTHLEVTAGAYVELEITDSGTGMDAFACSRIFDPFYTTKENGTGLGLATVHGIVKQSGGHIWVYSEPGRGTTFRVYLPQRESEPPAKELAAVVDISSLDGEETILVVEDNELLRPLIAQILGAYRYTLLIAANGVDALAIAKAHPETIDLLLTDVVMPLMNGRELAEHLVAENPRLRVLFSSGYPDDSALRAGIEAARVAFIQKPYNGDALLRKIRSILAAPS